MLYILHLCHYHIYISIKSILLSSFQQQLMRRINNRKNWNTKRPSNVISYNLACHLCNSSAPRHSHVQQKPHINCPERGWTTGGNTVRCIPHCTKSISCLDCFIRNPLPVLGLMEQTSHKSSQLKSSFILLPCHHRVSTLVRGI